MISKAIMTISAIQMGLAIYMGLYIPAEYHHMFAFSARDFFLIAFVGFCFGLYIFTKEKK